MFLQVNKTPVTYQDIDLTKVGVVIFDKESQTAKEYRCALFFRDGSPNIVIPQTAAGPVLTALKITAPALSTLSVNGIPQPPPAPQPGPAPVPPAPQPAPQGWQNSMSTAMRWSQLNQAFSVISVSQPGDYTITLTGPFQPDVMMILGPDLTSGFASDKTKVGGVSTMKASIPAAGSYIFRVYDNAGGQAFQVMATGPGVTSVQPYQGDDGLAAKAV